jgi:8-oxo-dGTP pyrophosphatase MutT (NUDIX family)
LGAGAALFSWAQDSEKSRFMEATTRETLQRFLRNHQPVDALEKEHLGAMVEHAARLEKPWSRDQATAHFTASALVVNEEGTQVCLVHHAKLQRWLQPGGHIDSETEPVEAASLREAREETGLDVVLHPSAPRPFDVDVHTIPARKTEPQHEHLDVRFLVVARNPEALTHDPSESLGARWFSWDEAIQQADDASLRRLMAKARSFLGR